MSIIALLSNEYQYFELVTLYQKNYDMSIGKENDNLYNYLRESLNYTHKEFFTNFIG